MRIIFIRHGQAEHNVAQKIVGDSAYEDPRFRDALLTPTGKEQCEAAGRDLAKKYTSFVACYTSPLTRCIQTAQILRTYIPWSTWIAADEIIECQGGNHICNTRSEITDIIQKYPDVDCTSLGPVPQHSRPRESFEEVRSRVIPFIETIIKTYNVYTNVCIVTHYDVLTSLFNGREVKNGEYIEISSDDFLRLNVYNMPADLSDSAG